MSKAKLYYEAHITVESMGKLWEEFKDNVDDFAEYWRVSKFDDNEVDDYNGKYFLSFREIDFEKMKKEVLRVIDILENEYNYSVLRWKIENTILDSRYGGRLI